MPKGRLLDVGCGEGWLSRAAAEQGWSVCAVDASASLIARACEHHQAEYLVVDYDALDTEPRLNTEFDCIVCNFSILSEDIRTLLRNLRSLVRPNGFLVVQTVHPWVASGAEPYLDGWREERFEGWDGGFEAPMPWFFRTLESWFSELGAAGWVVTTLREPADRASGKPLSVLLVCEPVGGSEY
jgi:2-polyprenyl-3-methyl-5-hydroxy-6-metoxy-1,4-benzoquinol methylase